MKPQDYRHDHAYFLIQDESVRAIAWSRNAKVLETAP